MNLPKTLLFNAEETQAMVNAIADSLISDIQSDNLKKILFIGIQSKGVPLAKRVSEIILEKCNIKIPVGILDISMYRDDIGKRKTLPHIHPTEIPFDLDDNEIILFDDVLHTGRTIRAALDAVTNYGRPKLIRLAVLIDRGGQEFPIMANYTAQKINLKNQNDFINMSWQETDLEDAVHIERR
jgi:pyrimidine operon attenuation protein/uracil phosphoribosyltransferase